MEARGGHPADRGPDRQLGHAPVRHHRRLPDVPDRHRPGGDPARRDRDDRGHPPAQAALPGGADHAGRVQRLVRPEPGGPRRAQLGVPRTSACGPGWTPRSCTPRRIMPIARIPDEQLQVALDLVYDRRREGYDPLARLLELFEGVDAAAVKASRAAELAGLPLWERLKRRIIDGERNGLEADLDEALAAAPGPGDRQRRPAGRDEDGRRAVRLRADAAAVRAPVRRGDEARGRLPGTAHGAVRRGRQGPHRAGHGQGRRARHRQEPGRHHPDQQRLRRGQHRHQAAGVGHRGRGDRARRRRRSACPACWSSPPW